MIHYIIYILYLSYILFLFFFAEEKFFFIAREKIVKVLRAISEFIFFYWNFKMSPDVYFIYIYIYAYIQIQIKD